MAIWTRRWQLDAEMAIRTPRWQSGRRDGNPDAEMAIWTPGPSAKLHHQADVSAADTSHPPPRTRRCAPAAVRRSEMGTAQAGAVERVRGYRWPAERRAGRSWVSHGVWGWASVAHAWAGARVGCASGGAPRALANGLRCSSDTRGTQHPAILCACNERTTHIEVPVRHPGERTLGARWKTCARSRTRHMIGYGSRKT